MGFAILGIGGRQAVRVAILTRLWARMPCPTQILAPSVPSIRLRSRPYPRLRALIRPSQPVRHCPPAHQTVVKAQEIQPLTVLHQMHDPGLRRLRFQPEVGQQDRQPRKRSLGLLPGIAHDNRVVGVSDQHTVPTFIPCPIDPVQVDVRQQRGSDPALWSASHRPPYPAVLHDPGAEHHPHQPQNSRITDAFRYRLHQLIERDRLEAIGDVRFHHPPLTPPGLINQHLQGIERRPFRAEPETARQKVGLKDRLEHDLHRRLHDTVTNRRDGKGPSLRTTGLRDEDPPCR